MKDEKQTNQDIKETLYEDLILSLRLARKGEMELSIREIATAIREVLSEEETSVLSDELL